MENNTINNEATVEVVESKKGNSDTVLDEIEDVMLDEINFYRNKENGLSIKNARLNITDRIVKSATIILAVENLKERRYMNRTERKSEMRKLEKTKNN